MCKVMGKTSKAKGKLSIGPRAHAHRTPARKNICKFTPGTCAYEGSKKVVCDEVLKKTTRQTATQARSCTAMPVTAGRWLPLQILLVAVVWQHLSSSCFGKPTQEPLSQIRERSGKSYRTKAAGRVLSLPLADAEKGLLTRISEASEGRQWSVVQSLFTQYHGGASQIYAAAMKGAFRCQRYAEGASIYDQWLQSGGLDHGPLFVFALKIFGKLGETKRVREVWTRAIDAEQLSPVLAGARIDAAADEGDVETAAAILDEMEKSSL